MKLLTFGAFDTPHIGHAIFLERCKRLSDEVIVAIHTDEFAASYKRTPAFPYEKRASIVARLGVRVIANTGPGREIIIAEKPDLLVVGTDWMDRDFLGFNAVTRAEIESWQIGIVYLPYTNEVSTTDILQASRPSS